MAAYTTAVLVGSYPSLPACTLTIVANGNSEDIAFASDDYYLHHATSALSMLDTLDTAITSHGDIATVTVVLQQDRKIKITSNAAFTLTWGGSGGTTLRDLLGFTGNLTPSATSFTASNISPLLWVPGRTQTRSSGRLGTTGLLVKDTQIGTSGTGYVIATNNNTWRENDLEWTHLLNGRVWTTAEAGGEYISFFSNVLSTYRRFNYHREVTMDEASTSAATLGTALGPYIYRGQGATRLDHERQYSPHIEDLHRIVIPCRTVPEY